jgi:RNA polymerase sigma-70 factor (ECF subfamily)
MAELSDQALIARVTMFGSRSAFDTLVRRHQSPLRRFLLHLTGGDSMLSDDLAQDTFIKAWIQLNTFKNKAAFETWLFRIAYNVFYDYIRSRKESLSLEETEREINSLYRTNADDSTLRSDIQKALAILSVNERTCITLFYMEEQPIKEIAIITGMPEGTIKSHLSRGKDKMTVYLKNNGYG